MAEKLTLMIEETAGSHLGWLDRESKSEAVPPHLYRTQRFWTKILRKQWEKYENGG